MLFYDQALFCNNTKTEKCFNVRKFRRKNYYIDIVNQDYDFSNMF